MPLRKREELLPPVTVEYVDNADELANNLMKMQERQLELAKELNGGTLIKLGKGHRGDHVCDFPTYRLSRQLPKGSKWRCNDCNKTYRLINFKHGYSRRTYVGWRNTARFKTAVAGAGSLAAFTVWQPWMLIPIAILSLIAIVVYFVGRNDMPARLWANEHWSDY